MIRRCLSGLRLLLAPVLLACPLPAIALEPEQREVIVISARVWDGYEYQETFIPSTREEMAVTAGHPSVITFVRTLEYYWPLSRQVYVDFQRQRDVIEGTLVVRQNGAEVSRQAPGVFSILYPEGAINGNGQILWNDEARAAHAEYREQEAAFARDFTAAQRAHSAYEQELLRAGAAREDGAPPATIPPPPPLPTPSLRLVTAPQPGFELALPPGQYTMALENGGTTVPGTDRRVRAVDLLGTEALVADVVPAERWTRPLASNTSTARIYARPASVLYLTLMDANQFTEADYLPIVSPQADSVAGRKLWVRRKPSGETDLTLAWGDDPQPLVRGPLKVDQTRGTSFGYTVRAAREGETADLDAFSIAVPSDPRATRGTVTLASDGALPFEREIVVVHPRQASLGLGLALLPLASFLAFAAWRHRMQSRQVPSG